jgi:hypothetical protein
LDETHILMLRLGSSRFQEFAMTDKSKKPSETARALLTAAAVFRGDYLIRPPQLPAAAARQVVRSLLNAGLAEEIPASVEDADHLSRKTDDGSDLMLRATDLGLARIGEAEGSVPASYPAETIIVAGPDTDGTVAPEQPLVGDVPTGEPSANQGVTQAPPQSDDVPTADESSDAEQDTPTVPVRAARQSRLRQAARALPEAWGEAASADALDEHFAALRAALAVEGAASLSIDHPRLPRDTKRAQVLAMLSRPEGASGPQIAEAMGWAPHTVRGFLAGLAKKGMAVEVVERVRQIGPNKAGARGSYSIYRISRT